MKIKMLIGGAVAVGSMALLSAAPAGAVKPAQGSTFQTGTCTTTTGHGSNATQTTDTGNCGSAENPNKGGTSEGTNTGHGFVN